jgi:hypothetical protein
MELERVPIIHIISYHVISFVGVRVEQETKALIMDDFKGKGDGYGMLTYVVHF